MRRIRERATKRLRLPGRRGVIAAALAGAFALAPGASAAQAPIQVGSPLSEEQPAVAVDSTGSAIIAWANTKDVGEVKDFVEYCVLPKGAVGCGHSGKLTPAGGAQHVDRVQVLVDGGALVILADVFGGSEETTPEQEWQSTDGGATWTAVAAGDSVASGILNADTEPVGAVIAPGTGVLGYGWVTAAGAPTFNAFPFSSPPECSIKSCPAGFATLEPNTNPDTLSNEEGQFAAISSGPNAGVMGVFETLFTNGPLGCAADFGTAYVFGSGNQSASNSYNISPGQPNSAWRVPVTQAACDVEYPAVGGGPSGFGVLERELASDSTIYQRFDQTTEKFDIAPVTVAPEPELDPALSQDATGGIYATYLDGPGGAVRLAYSGDGGAKWVSSSLDAAGVANDLTSSTNGPGQGWAAWVQNGSVFAQPFQAVDAVSATTPTTTITTQTSGVTSGADISIVAGTVGETDRAFISGASAATATGTVTYDLFSNKSCSPGTIVAQNTEPVAAGTGGAAEPITLALAPASYYWQVHYSGNASTLEAPGNQPSVSACGSEVLKVQPAAVVGEAAAASGGSVTVTITCAVTPCTVTVTVTIPAAAAAHAKKKPKRITIATGTFKIKKHGAQKLTLHLNGKGRRALARHHDKLTALLLLTEKVDGHLERVTKTLKIRPKSHH